jgi:sec-independent protein translocase protein TatB
MSRVVSDTTRDIARRLPTVFNLQGSELIIILLLALVVLGPEKLPDAMRKAGQFYAELKRMSAGFQQEFKAVVDEPMREVRDTANMLRDSADFRTLQTGERDEKPKSAEMVAAADPDATPVDEVPSFEGAPVDDPVAESADEAGDEPDPDKPAGADDSAASAEGDDDVSDEESTG